MVMRYPGQGINFETMNLGSLKGYSQVVHFILLQIIESVLQLNLLMDVQQRTLPT